MAIVSTEQFREQTGDDEHDDGAVSAALTLAEQAVVAVRGARPEGGQVTEGLRVDSQGYVTPSNPPTDADRGEVTDDGRIRLQGGVGMAGATVQVTYSTQPVSAEVRSAIVKAAKRALDPDRARSLPENAVRLDDDGRPSLSGNDPTVLLTEREQRELAEG